MKEQTSAAVSEAAQWLRALGGDEARVVLFKETKARGRERDRSFIVYADDRGRYRSQYMGR